METNKHRSDEGWVGERMDLLSPETGWEPDFHRTMARLQGRPPRAGLLTPRRVLLASLVLVLGVGVAGVMKMRSVAASDRILKDRQAAPDFALPDSTGAVIRLSGYRHKVVLVNFWATWCGGCQKEIPWLMDFQTRYKDRGFAVIGVSMDDTGFKMVAPFCMMKKMNYPVVIGNERLTRLYGVEAMPETVLIDGAGKIAAFHLGLVDKGDLDREIRSLLD